VSLCAPWDLDLECCDLPDGVAEETIEYWQGVASEILYVASGRRYGPCPITVRPCLRRCGGGSGLPVPYKGADGAWRNYSACGCTDDCSCVELSEIVLQGPVASITEVSIDGTVLDPAAYRLDRVGDGYRLVRIDGGTWPECSDMTAGCDEVGSFCVTYEQGIAPDGLAIAAVSELTCEFVKACIPGCKTCRLPKNVQSATRRGVSQSFDTTKAWLWSLPMVASFLQATNPEGLTSASSVWSPDVGHQRITPQPAGS
jgi:hypothetical protein